MNDDARKGRNIMLAVIVGLLLPHLALLMTPGASATSQGVQFGIVAVMSFLLWQSYRWARSYLAIGLGLAALLWGMVAALLTAKVWWGALWFVLPALYVWGAWALWKSPKVEAYVEYREQERNPDMSFNLAGGPRIDTAIDVSSDPPAVTDATPATREPAFPPLTQRYLSSVIDGILFLFFMVAVTVSLQGQDRGMTVVRMGLIFGALLTYEPILTSKAATVGQLVAKIRVRQLNDPGSRISLGRAYLRSIVKVLLGWYSFLTMGFNKERRAVHDFAAGSVVLNAPRLP